MPSHHQFSMESDFVMDPIPKLYTTFELLALPILLKYQRKTENFGVPQVNFASLFQNYTHFSFSISFYPNVTMLCYGIYRRNSVVVCNVRAPYSAS